MKILHCITRFNQGGTVTWLNQLMMPGVFDSDEVFLLFGACSSNEIEGTPAPGYKVLRSKFLKRAINPLGDFRAILEIRKVFEKIRPDILVTHTFKAGLVARIGAMTIVSHKRPRVVHTIHGHLQYGYFGNLGSRVTVFLEKRLERFTDFFIVAGTRLMKEVKASGQLRKSKCAVILPGIDSSAFKERTKGLEPQGRMQIGWLGRMARIKRPDRLVEIAKRIPEADFQVGGTGELEISTRESAPSNMTLVGWANPSDFWQNVDIGLLTSDNEATPYSIIEGSLCGVPFVASDVGSVSDALADGETGYLVRTDVESFVAKIQILIRDSNIRRKFGSQARELSLGRFGISRFQREHREIFLKVMNG